MSIHTQRALGKAMQMGAASARAENSPLWDWPKRELIEIVLHLASICAEGEADAALQNGGAYRRAVEERDALRANGLI